MLTHLNIRNFAIIDELAIDLEQGLTVVTGETGAGKSIMVDALSLVLGDRAEASVIRAEASQAEISAQFTISELPQVQRWLAEQALEADDDCILRRIIHREKSSKGYINGRPATMQMLRELGELLVDIHGQHAHQGLSKRPVQLAILDQFGQLTSQRAALADLWHTWRSTQ
jgi:DNA repair protein RecN (Recombination protein N)